MTGGVWSVSFASRDPDSGRETACRRLFATRAEAEAFARDLETDIMAGEAGVGEAWPVVAPAAESDRGV